MADVQTRRLLLHAIDEPAARRLLAQAPGGDDRWAAGYPSAGDLASVGAFLRATEEQGDQRPFGHYQVILREGGLVVGGVGFKGRPRAGRVEVGYGLIPSARGHGYAAEALTALLAVAADHGVTTVLADTTHDNTASQRTLLRTGFTLVGEDARLRHYETCTARATAR